MPKSFLFLVPYWKRRCKTCPDSTISMIKVPINHWNASDSGAVFLCFHDLTNMFQTAWNAWYNFFLCFSKEVQESNFRLYWKLPAGLAASIFYSRDVLQRRCATVSQKRKSPTRLNPKPVDNQIPWTPNHLTTNWISNKLTTNIIWLSIHPDLK